VPGKGFENWYQLKYFSAPAIPLIWYPVVSFISY